MTRLVGCLAASILIGSVGLAQDSAQKEDGLNVKGKLTKEDAKDKVRVKSFHKVHKFKMKKGATYVINLRSRKLDPYLRLEDADGKQLAFNDDAEGLNSQIVYTPKKTSGYRIIVTTFSPGATGPYVLTVNRATGAFGVFQKLKSEHRQALSDLLSTYRKAKDEKEKAKILQEYRGVGAKFVPKALAFAEKHSDDPIAESAMSWIFRTLRLGDALRIRYENAYKAKDKNAPKIYKESLATLKRIGKQFPKFEKQATDSQYLLSKLSIGKKAPEIEAEDIDGVKFKLSDYRGKITVVDFWGDW